jgi:predicted metal-binding membrane protein
MSMPHQPWYGAAAEYLGMWMAMMVPMMLPSLVPMLARYRRSVRGDGSRRHGSMVLVALGYFSVWAGLGAAVYAVGAGVVALEARQAAVAQWLPLGPGVVLLLAGAVQLSSWKARQLTRCRDGLRGEFAETAGPVAPWRDGLTLGLRCSLSCGSLMLALLAVGMMEPVAMGAATLAIAGERLAPSRLRVARLAGTAIVVTGVLMIAQV